MMNAPHCLLEIVWGEAVEGAIRQSNEQSTSPQLGHSAEWFWEHYIVKKPLCYPCKLNCFNDLKVSSFPWLAKKAPSCWNDARDP
jgi:hypothetical protein